MQYSSALDATLRSQLSAIEKSTEALGFDMASEPLVGEFLRMLVASKPVGRILELGTGTGLSTAWMCAGLSDDATLLSVDNDAQVQNVAKEHLADPRIQFVCEDGEEFLRKQEAGQFDLIFADAWPGKYNVLDETLDLLKPGGIYIVDDLLPQTNWPQGHQASVDAFIADMTSRKEFQVSLLNWASGLLLAVRKS